MCDQTALASGLALARTRRAGGFSAGAERLNWGTRAARPANLMIRTIRVIRAQRPRLVSRAPAGPPETQVRAWNAGSSGARVGPLLMRYGFRGI